MYVCMRNISFHLNAWVNEEIILLGVSLYERVSYHARLTKKEKIQPNSHRNTFSVGPVVPPVLCSVLIFNAATRVKVGFKNNNNYNDKIK